MLCFILWYNCQVNYSVSFYKSFHKVLKAQIAEMFTVKISI